MLISLILPTRKRPHNIIRLLDSVYAVTSKENNIEVCGRVDQDDMESVEALLGYRNNFDVRICIGPKESNHGHLWNDAWKISRGDLLMMVGDDFIFRTPNWDKRIVEEFSKHKNQIAYVFGEDGIQHGAIGTHGIVSRKWTDTLGYFVPMDFNVFYHDTWLTDLAYRIGKRVYIPELLFEHMHHVVGKAVKDEVYQKMDEKMGDDNRRWHETTEKRRVEAEKLRALI